MAFLAEQVELRCFKKNQVFRSSSLAMNGASSSTIADQAGFGHRTLWKKKGSSLMDPKPIFFGGITSRGAVSIKIFEENLNSAGYKKILQSKTQEMHSLFLKALSFNKTGVQSIGLILMRNISKVLQCFLKQDLRAFTFLGISLFT